MTDERFTSRDDAPIGREEILIGRVMDEEAAAADWAELESLAAADPAVWNRLARAKRDHDALRAGFESAARSIDTVEVPASYATAVASVSVRWRAWSGWAVAAAVGLAWIGAQGLLPMLTRPSNFGASTAGVLPVSLTPDEALDAYLSGGQATGRVLGELPKVMVQTRPAEEGGQYEVLYIRQIYERKIVNQLLKVVEDDQGRPALAPLPAHEAVINEPI